MKRLPDSAGNKKKKVLIALSGGIDSAVSAYLLLKRGYDVEAAFMKNWSSTAGLLKSDCPWLEDRQDALRVAAFLRIPLHTLDFEKQYGKTVMKYFFNEYQKGRTPNPDVMCNKEIKFKLLYNWAMDRGFGYLATGHYAQIVGSGQWAVGKKNKKNYPLLTNHYSLHRSADEFKDQTYFIYNIKTSQLPHLLFPIGDMKKSAVRSLARKLKLPNAEKKESMGLCFVGKIRLKDFLEQKLKPKAGPIIFASSDMSLRGGAPATTKQSNHQKKIASLPLAMTGRVIGQHHGLYNFTIGQRQGIQVGASGPYFVTRKDLKTNTLFVTNNPDDTLLQVKELQIHSVNWITNPYNLQPTTYNLFGRYRHQGQLVPLKIKKIGADNYLITFKQPQKAVASGQSLVLYKGKQCLGGGIII